ncbi:MAG: hypothetical protein KKF30_04845 [Proteobacteria bacterium]|nr:hypothetical protein [Pseudomonadota bacterium]MBU4470486.1 hypothetical protein [Pseudomonadota bacterium]MCG2753539.1 hypothetical protein [Desulfobacteraceae bacterium]
MLKSLKDLKTDRELINAIDWDMTPEEAVRLYLEWGNNWARGNYVIRSKNDVSHYFVVNTWKEKPVIYLIKRSSEDAQELALIEIPEKIRARFSKQNGFMKGVYAVDGEVKQWLKKELGNA